jgi:endonuclease III
MKNSKDYSPKIESLFKTLSTSADPVVPPTYSDPVDAIVYAFISAFTTETNAVKIHRRVRDHFVDMNDLRVSRPEEILEVFGDTSDAAAASAQALTATLNAIFEKYDKVSLQPLGGEGKRQARKELDELAGITPFAAAYTFLTALGGHAIPLTEPMVKYLRDKELVHPEATIQEIESFLERHIAAADAYPFYVFLRAEAEGRNTKSTRAKTASRGGSGSKNTKKKKTTQKKTSKK